MRKNLKLLRVSKDLTQEEFAKKTGVDRVTYSLVERGKRKGNPAFWEAVQSVFDISDAEMWNLQKIEKGCKQCEQNAE